MTRDDIDVVVQIIGSHDKWDAACARSNYEEYFDNLDKHSGEKNYVAVDETTSLVIGVCGYSRDKYNLEDVMWLNWFYVNMEFIGKGIGFELINYIIDKIKAQNIRKLYLDTSNGPTYDKAQAFYKQYGFILEAKLRNYYGNGEDFIIYGMDL